MRALHLLPAVWLAIGVVAAVAAPDLSEITVDVVAEERPVRDVLQDLQVRHGLNYVVSQRTLEDAGLVNVQLKQVPLDAALQAICSACGLNLEINGPILVILPKTQAPRLPEVTTGVLRKGANQQPVRPRRPAPPATTSSPETAPPPAVGARELMAVGDVVEVDLPNRRLRLVVDGAKRDFYLPPVDRPDPKLQTARLGQALAKLKKGHRVALLYELEGARSLLTNLIGGTKVADAEVPGRTTRGRETAPRQPKKVKRPPPAPQPGTRTAPESENLPEGVLAGRFVSRDGEEIRIRRADGEVLTSTLR